MVGYDHEYYPVQVEIIDRRRSYISGYRTRAEALAAARQQIASRHAGTILAGTDCTVLIHTPYASRLLHRRPGHTNRDIRQAS